LSGTGAIPISAEYNFLNFERNIQAGLFAAYSSTSEDYYYYNSGKWSYTYIVIAAQGNWHFTPGEKFDPFAGISIGYRIGTVSWSWNGTAGPYSPSSASASDIFLSAQAGFNYWFSPKWALQLRVGYFPYASVGVTANL
jgi:outer membrane protein W